MNNQQYPLAWLIPVVVFYGIIILIIFDICRVGGIPALFMIPMFLIIIYDWVRLTEWNPIFSNKNFICHSGVIGVVDEPLTPVHGGKSRIVVSVKKQYCPKEKWFRLGGLKGLMSHVAGRVQIAIVDDTWKFHEITGGQLEAPEGAIVYQGSLSGNAPYDLHQSLTRQLDEAYSIISLQESIYERAKQLGNSMARSNNQDILEVSQKFGIIMREWSETLNKPTGNPAQNPSNQPAR